MGVTLITGGTLPAGVTLTTGVAPTAAPVWTAPGLTENRRFVNITLILTAYRSPSVLDRA